MLNILLIMDSKVKTLSSYPALSIDKQYTTHFHNRLDELSKKYSDVVYPVTRTENISETILLNDNYIIIIVSSICLPHGTFSFDPILLEHSLSKEDISVIKKIGVEICEEIRDENGCVYQISLGCRKSNGELIFFIIDY